MSIDNVRDLENINARCILMTEKTGRSTNYLFRDFINHRGICTNHEKRYKALLHHFLNASWNARTASISSPSGSSPSP